MKEKIGQTAGKIWETLKEKEELNVSRIPGILKEKSEVAYQALGWLAREEKIIYNNKSDKTFVSLSDSERNV